MTSIQYLPALVLILIVFSVTTPSDTAHTRRGLAAWVPQSFPRTLAWGCNDTKTTNTNGHLSILTGIVSMAFIVKERDGSLCAFERKGCEYSRVTPIDQHPKAVTI